MKYILLLILSLLNGPIKAFWLPQFSLLPNDFYNNKEETEKNRKLDDNQQNDWFSFQDTVDKIMAQPEPRKASAPKRDWRSKSLSYKSPEKKSPVSFDFSDLENMKKLLEPKVDSPKAPEPEPIKTPFDKEHFHSSHSQMKRHKKWNGNEYKSFGLDIKDFASDHIDKSTDLDPDLGYVGDTIPKFTPRSLNLDQLNANLTLNGLRKYRQLKSMILYLQESPEFNKYCFYGCWCFLEGSSNLQSGYGKPRDQVDSACMHFSKCYRCLEIDYGHNFDPEARYKYAAGTDMDNKFIECLDPEGTMKRNLCECDRELAYELQKAENSWSVDFHSKQSDFDRKHSCFTPLGQCTADECCGNYPKRVPYCSAQGKKGCCSGKVYNLEYFDCVDNNVQEL